MDEEKKGPKLQSSSQIRIEPPKEITIKKEEDKLKTGNVADVQPTVQLKSGDTEDSFTEMSGPIVEGVVPTALESGVVVKQTPVLGGLYQLLLVLSIVFILLSGWILISQALNWRVPFLSR